MTHGTAGAPHGWWRQISSDPYRDGLALELWSPTNEEAADVLCDAHAHTVHVERYGVEIPVAVWEWFTREAVAFVASFNDLATPLDPAGWSGFSLVPSAVQQYRRGE